VIAKYHVISDSYIFYDALVHLGAPGVNLTANPVRVIGYCISNAKYYVATDRLDLTADQIALIY